VTTEQHSAVPSWYPDLWSSDRTRQNTAYTTALDATENPVDWATAVWDDTLDRLSDPDNHNRSIAAQLLCRLAVNEPDRIITALPALIEVTRDSRFVTARHSLQSLWRIACAGTDACRAVVDALTDRFEDCIGEKNATLIRSDIVEGLANIQRTDPDQQLEQTALELIDTEPDEKYRTKYRRVWRKSIAQPSSA